MKKLSTKEVKEIKKLGIPPINLIKFENTIAYLKKNKPKNGRKEMRA